MNELTTRYQGRGFQVLGFPANQFGYQENYGNSEILLALKYVRPGGGFVPNFPLFGKMDVNGDASDAIWQWIRSELPYPSDDPYGVITQSQTDVLWKPVTRTDIGWNFEKFLFSRDGRPYRRWSEPVRSLAIAPEIEKLLNQSYYLEF